MNLKNLIRTGLCVLVLSFSATVLPAVEIGAAQEVASTNDCCDGCDWLYTRFFDGGCRMDAWDCSGTTNYIFNDKCSMLTQDEPEVHR
jgi:hypothetical protein